MNKFVPTDSELLAKQLFRLGVHKAGGPKSVQEWTGLDPSEISRLGSDDVDRHVHFSRIIELDQASGYSITKALARRAGFELVDADQAAKERETVAHAAVAALEANTAFISTTLEAGADGKATNHEIRNAETKKNAAIAMIERAFDALAALRKS